MKVPFRSARSGYTLTELALAAVILAVTLGSLALFGGTSAGALGEGTSQAELDARLRRTMTRLGDELLPSGLGVITLAAGGKELTYRRSAGPVDGHNTWEAPRRFRFAYERGELDDGLDNNGNGLVDEGVVEWTIDVGLASERTVVLCHGVSELDGRETDDDLDEDGDGLVDEGGFAVRQDVNVMHVGLTLERLDADAHTLKRSIDTAVQPRN